jgi:hypothetical protein
LNLGRGQDPGSGKKIIPDPWSKKAPDPGSGSATLLCTGIEWEKLGIKRILSAQPSRLATSSVADPNQKESETFWRIRIRNKKFRFGYGFGSRHYNLIVEHDKYRY